MVRSVPTSLPKHVWPTRWLARRVRQQPWRRLCLTRGHDPSFTHPIARCTMIRSTLVLSVLLSSLAVAACSDVTGPHRSGSDDPIGIDRKGKGQDSLPHAALVSFSREAQPGDVQREPEARREAEARQENEIRREPENRQEAQPGDVRQGKGKDDPANHG